MKDEINYSEMLFNRDERLLDYITNLQQENKHLNLQLDQVLKDYDELQERIDKAIEYIKTHKVSDTISFPLMKREEENQVKSCFDYEFNLIYKKELLEKLGDKE